MFGIGRYQVTVQLPRTAGVYPGGNVTFRGAEGRIKDVRLTDTGWPQCCRSSRASPSRPISTLGAVVRRRRAVHRTAAAPRLGSPAWGDVISGRPDHGAARLRRGARHALDTGLKSIPRDDLRPPSTVLHRVRRTRAELFPPSSPAAGSSVRTP